MKESTLKITTGAMFIAIFAIILLLNRQTGSFFEEMIFYILPIPMVAYSAKYGWKPSIPVLIAMGLTSVIFGTFTTIFYAVSESFIGMVLGTCIYKKVDPTKALFAVMFLSVIVNVLNTIVLASLFGYDLAEEITAMREMMNTSMEQAQNIMNLGGAESQQLESVMSMMTPEFLMRMMIISMVALGALQGFIIFQLSQLILNRLKFPISKPKSIFEYYPPRWMSYIAVGMFLPYFLGFSNAIEDSRIAVTLQTIGICGYMYLILFGFIGLVLYVRVRIKDSGLLAGGLAMLAFLALPMLELFVGILYTCSRWHEVWMGERKPREKKKRSGERSSYRGTGDASANAALSGDRDVLPAETAPEVTYPSRYAASARAGSNSQRPGGKRSIADLAHINTMISEDEEGEE